MSKISCSILILTHNEEANLPHVLESVVDWAEAVYVVDSGSTDRTREIAEGHGARFFEHPWTTHADQLNWALENLPVTTDWVMRMDADEIVMPELARELAETLPALPEDVTGLYVKRRVYFMGRWIRHGSYYPTWLLRVFRRGAARSENLSMDEHFILLHGRSERLRHDIIDENHKGLGFWTMKHEGYARREMENLLAQACETSDSAGLDASLWGEQAGRKRWFKTNIYARSPLFLRAFAYFSYRYFLRLGFLDGVEGLIFHVLQGFWYRFYVDAKIWEQRKK